MSILAATLILSVQTPPFSVTPGKTVPELRPIALAAAPSGSKFAACMEDGSVRIIDANTHATVRVLDKHPQPAYAVAWSPDGLLIATGDETARVWVASAVSGKKLREYRVHIRGIQKLSFNVSANLLASTGKDDVIKVYDLTSTSPKELREILGKGMNFYGATFSPTLPNALVTGTLGAGARFYDARTGGVLGFLNVPAEPGIFDLEYNQNGSRAVSAGRDDNVVIWDTKTDQRLGSCKGHSDWVVDVAFSPNGKYLASSSTDRTVRIWNIFNFQKVAQIDNQSFVGSPVIFTADGKSLITVNDQGYLQFNSIQPAQPNVVAPAAVPAKKPVVPTKKPVIPPKKKP